MSSCCVGFQAERCNGLVPLIFTQCKAHQTVAWVLQCRDRIVSSWHNQPLTEQVGPLLAQEAPECPWQLAHGHFEPVGVKCKAAAHL